LNKMVVMHADELNTCLSEEDGKPIYHYHLHVIAIPVVKSHSKKWKSEQLTDNFGNPVYNVNIKRVLYQ